MSAFARTESLARIAPEDEAAGPRPYSPPTIEMEEANESSRTPYFDRVPDDILRRIFGQLGPLDLVRMSEVDRRFAAVSRSLPLWQRVAAGESWAPAQGSNTTVNTYVNAYKKHVLDERAAAEQAAQQAHYAKMQDREDLLGSLLVYMCYNKVVEWLCAACYIIFTALVACRLDHRIDCAWPVVFIPLYVALGLTIVAPALLCVFSVFTDYADFEESFELGKHRLIGPSISFVLGRPFENTLPERVTPFWFFIMHVVTLVVLVSLKLAGADFLWSLALIPVYTLALLVVGLLLCLEPCILADTDASERLIWLPLAPLIALAAGFIAAQLDELVHWSWHVVFVPAYMAVIYALFVHITGLVCVGTGFTDRLYSDKSYLGVPFVGSLIILVVPLIAFVPVLGQVLDGVIDSTWVTVFAPIWIGDILLFMTCLSVQCAFSD